MCTLVTSSLEVLEVLTDLKFLGLYSRGHITSPTDLIVKINFTHWHACPVYGSSQTWRRMGGTILDWIWSMQTFCEEEMIPYGDPVIHNSRKRGNCLSLGCQSLTFTSHFIHLIRNDMRMAHVPLFCFLVWFLLHVSSESLLAHLYFLGWMTY